MITQVTPAPAEHIDRIIAARPYHSVDWLISQYDQLGNGKENWAAWHYDKPEAERNEARSIAAGLRLRKGGRL